MAAPTSSLCFAARRVVELANDMTCRLAAPARAFLGRPIGEACRASPAGFEMLLDGVYVETSIGHDIPAEFERPGSGETFY
jgi:hypothetical protein